MRFRPSWILAACAVQSVALLAASQWASAPEVGVAGAAAFEGAGAVRVTGVVADLDPGDGWTRLALQGDGVRLDVRVEGEAHVPEGAWVEARGRLVRFGGMLTLAVHGSEDLAVVAGPEPLRVTWDDLAEHPEAWPGKALAVEGRVESGRLHDGDGHHAALGAGRWPPSGHVRATVTLHYDPGCLCHRLAASEVRPVGGWTS